jgi:hypothetical protein
MSKGHGLGLPELTEILQLNEKIEQIENRVPPHLKRHNNGKRYTFC